MHSLNYRAHVGYSGNKSEWGGEKTKKSVLYLVNFCKQRQILFYNELKTKFPVNQ